MIAYLIPLFALGYLKPAPCVILAFDENQKQELVDSMARASAGDVESGKLSGVHILKFDKFQVVFHESLGSMASLRAFAQMADDLKPGDQKEFVGRTGSLPSNLRDEANRRFAQVGRNEQSALRDLGSLSDLEYQVGLGFGVQFRHEGKQVYVPCEVRTPNREIGNKPKPTPQGEKKGEAAPWAQGIQFRVIKESPDKSEFLDMCSKFSTDYAVMLRTAENDFQASLTRLTDALVNASDIGRKISKSDKSLNDLDPKTRALVERWAKNLSKSLGFANSDDALAFIRKAEITGFRYWPEVKVSASSTDPNVPPGAFILPMSYAGGLGR